jgi:hypothetical protein
MVDIISLSVPLKIENYYTCTCIWPLAIERRIILKWSNSSCSKSNIERWVDKNLKQILQGINLHWFKGTSISESELSVETYIKFRTVKNLHQIKEVKNLLCLQCAPPLWLGYGTTFCEHHLALLIFFLIFKKTFYIILYIIPYIIFGIVKNLHQIQDGHSSPLYHPNNQSESQTHDLSANTQCGKNQGATVIENI